MRDILRRLHAADVGMFDDGAEGGGDEALEEGEGDATGGTDGGGDAAASSWLSEETKAKLLRRIDETGELQVTAEDLTPEELEAFEAALARGEVDAAESEVPPWWEGPRVELPRLGSDGTPPIVDLGEAEGPEPAPTLGSEVPPPPLRPLPPIGAMTGGRGPSPLVAHGVAGALAAWAYACRQLGPEGLEEDAVSPAETMAALEATLRGDAPGPTLSEAVRGVLGAAEASGPRGAREAALVAFADASAVLALGRVAALLALVDAARAVSAGVAALKRTGGQGTRRAERRRADKLRALRAARRKLDFYTSWVNELPEGDLQALAEDLRASLAALAPEPDRPAPAVVEVPSSG